MLYPKKWKQDELIIKMLDVTGALILETFFSDYESSTKFLRIGSFIFRYNWPNDTKYYSWVLKLLEKDSIVKRSEDVGSANGLKYCVINPDALISLYNRTWQQYKKRNLDASQPESFSTIKSSQASIR